MTEFNKRKILVISQYFYPENFRINDICEEWVKQGHDVTVITAIPNYPFGKFYKGYGFFNKRTEYYNGINVKRLPIIPRGNKSYTLILNYLSFVFSGFFWAHLTQIKADLVFTFEVSPMTQALLGVWYSKRKKIPAYIYVQDLWPENVEHVAGIHNKSVLNYIGKMVDFIYKHHHGIFTTSKGFAEAIHRRGVERSKLHYLPQYAEDYYEPSNIGSIPEIEQNDNLKIIFTGNVGFAQGLDVLPKVACKLKERGFEQFKFIIVGDGRFKNELINQVVDLSLCSHFQFIDSQPPERVKDFLSVCDLAFLSLSSNPLFYLTIPAKLQTYMACAMPIIASVQGESKDIIESSGAGFCSRPGDADQIAENILKAKNMSLEELALMGKKARKYYESNFAKARFFNEINDFFQTT